MNLGRSILRLFNINRSERGLVFNLMAVRFFQGAGIAFFFTAAFALFLEALPISDLPIVFILAALMLFFTGSVFAWLEHRINMKSLGVFIAFSMALSILLIRLFAKEVNPAWFTVLMLSWYYVIYLLNNLNFWGIASVRFDIRQSKRLFGLISSGDIPAKFVGYSLASVLVLYIGTMNLFLVGAGLILASIPFLLNIHKLEIPEEEKRRVHKMQAEPTGRLGTLIRRFTSNKLIEKAAILAFLFSLSLFLINFIFYSEVKTAYKEDKALAQFIATFMAVSRIVALLLKMILTGRLLARLGPKRSLMITPIILFLFTFMVIFSDIKGLEDRVIFYLFGMLAIAADVLNSSIHMPGFFTLMQPMPKLERLRAHNIVKGVMDPFAYLATGIFLILFIHFNGEINIRILTYGLGILLLFWVIGIFQVNKEYRQMLIRSITSRSFNNEEISIADNGSAGMIRKKLKDGSLLEKIYLLNLLEKDTSLPGRSELLLLALNDDATDIRKAAVNAMKRTRDELEVKGLAKRMMEEEDPTVLSLIIQILLEFRPDLINLKDFADHPDSRVRQKVITYLFEHKEHPLYNEIKLRVYRMAHSPDPRNRSQALEILDELGSLAPEDMVIGLTSDQREDISSKAFLTVAKVGTPRCINHILTEFLKGVPNTLEALEFAPSTAVEKIIPMLRDNKLDDTIKHKLIRICGRIGDAEHAARLSDLIKEVPEHATIIIDALKRCRYSARKDQQGMIDELIKDHLESSSKLIAMAEHMQSGSAQDQLLAEALKLELDERRERIIDLFAFLFDRHNIEKIKKGLKSGNKVSKDIALELIEVSLPGKYVQPFTSLYESRPQHHQQGKPDKLEPAQRKAAIHEDILTDKSISYNSWTKACCLYAMKAEGLNNPELAEPYLNSTSLILRETAEFYTKQLN